MSKKAYLEKLKKLVKPAKRFAKAVVDANPAVKAKRKLKKRLKFAKEKKIRSMIPYDNKKDPAPEKRVKKDTYAMDSKDNPLPLDKKKKRKMKYRVGPMPLGKRKKYKR